jgi:glycosyltransferase involved in cell wall biosynthesis
LGAAGRERITEHFSWDRFGSETIQAYEDAVGSKT